MRRCISTCNRRNESGRGARGRGNVHTAWERVRRLGLYKQLFKHHGLDVTSIEMDGAQHDIQGSGRLAMFVLKKNGDEALLRRL